MKIYQTKSYSIPGKNYPTVKKIALTLFNRIKRKSKRTPYIKSRYFNKQKIFLNIFWNHIFEKHNFEEKTRRLKLFECGIELIQQTTVRPNSVDNPTNKNETLHRFKGISKDNIKFIVQIKEHKKNGRKYFISIFPTN